MRGRSHDALHDMHQCLCVRAHLTNKRTNMLGVSDTTLAPTLIRKCQGRVDRAVEKCRRSWDAMLSLSDPQ